MLSKKSLPILLVSAGDSKTAHDLVVKLISEATSPEHASGHVWRMQNKYYTADVEVRVQADGEQLPCDTNLIEAHIVHLSEQECAESKEVWERRVTSTGTDGLGEVRLVLVDAEDEPAGLQAAARQRLYEVVTLRPRGREGGDSGSDGEDSEGEGVCGGWERVREALQAHMWTGLCMVNKTAPPQPCNIESLSALAGTELLSEWSSSDGSGRESDEEGAVERAELFASALQLLPTLEDGGGDVVEGGAGDEERRRRAEELVTAFCRALGHDLDVL